MGLGGLRALWNGSPTEKKRFGGMLSLGYLFSAIGEVVSPQNLAIVEKENLNIEQLLMEDTPAYFTSLRAISGEDIWARVPKTFSFWTTLFLGALTAFSVVNYSENNSEKRSIVINYSEAERKEKILDILNKRIPKVIHVKEEENPNKAYERSRGMFKVDLPQMKDLYEK